MMTLRVNFKQPNGRRYTEVWEADLTRVWMFHRLFCHASTVKRAVVTNAL